MRITPAIELEHRCSRFQKIMAETELEAVIIASSANLFYFTGTTQRGVLYIPVSGQPLYLVEKNHLRARMESGLMEVLPFSAIEDMPRFVTDFSYPMPKSIGMELSRLPSALRDRFCGVFGNALSVDATELIYRTRMIKSHYEIHLLQDAATQVDRVYRGGLTHIRAGMTDLALAAEIEKISRLEGHPGITRMGDFNAESAFAAVISGADSAVPSFQEEISGGLGLSTAFGYGAGYKPIISGEPILFRLSGCCDGYYVKQGRVAAVNHLSERLHRGYDDMLRIEERLKKMIPDLPLTGELYREAFSMARSMGYEENYLGLPAAKSDFIGKGIGVEVDEYPYLSGSAMELRLEGGMAFTLEPMLVFPGEGTVGMQNSFYISNSGELKQLTFSVETVAITV